MYNLGLTYELGKYGQRSDIPQAIFWYEKGVGKEDIGCMTNLGFIYLERLEDYTRAVELFSHVAELFDGKNTEALPALNNLGTCYKRGLGCTKNAEKAVECYLKAAEHGSPEAMFNLFKFYSDDLAVGHNYEKAKEWLVKAAEAGVVEAIMKVAEGYAKGILFEQNHTEAVRYYKLAADKGDPEAMVTMGKCYLDGLGIEQNYEKAKQYFLKAIDVQYFPGYYHLGLFYCNEQLDYVEAARCFSIAANAGFPPAEYELGVCYRHGHGLPVDMKKALWGLLNKSN